MYKKLHIDYMMQTQQCYYTKTLNEVIFNYPFSTCQIIAYSKQIKELENTIQQKNQQIEVLKRDTRKTIYTELQIVDQVIQQEYEELQKIIKSKDLQGNINLYVNPYQFLTNTYKLNKDNIYLAKQLYENQQITQQQNARIKKIETQLLQSNFQSQQIERIITELVIATLKDYIFQLKNYDRNKKHVSVVYEIKIQVMKITLKQNIILFVIIRGSFQHLRVQEGFLIQMISIYLQNQRIYQ